MQIVIAVKDEYGCDLKITSLTEWKEVPSTLKEQLLVIGAEHGRSI
jgi:acyl carrier protein